MKDAWSECGPSGGRVTAGLTVPDSEWAFRAMLAAFKQAARVRPDCVVESSYILAGQHARVRIVGPTLAELLGGPFTHLGIREAVSPTPSLTIDLWNEDETGIPCPVAPSDDERESRWRIGDGVLSLSTDRRFVSYQLRQSLVCLDRKSYQIIGWMASAKHLTLYERGKPLHIILSMWLHDRNIQVIHAGLISRNGQGVLFPGMGGVGKSTSTLACLSAGLDYLGDDCIGLQVVAEGSFVGHSLYNSTWLDPDHMARFPLLPPHAIHGLYPWEEKSLVLLSHVFPRRLSRLAPIRVLALPRIVDASSTRFRPASKAETLLRLIPSSLLQQLLPPGVSGFQRLAQLAEHVPSYWLELGRDLREIPRAVEQLLGEATRK